MRKPYHSLSIMRDILRRTTLLAATAAAFVAATTTSCIDEDLSECGKDYRIGYTVRLHTNINTEIDSELTTDAERAFGQRLRDALKDVFSDRARDIDLAFYTTANAQLAQREQHQMDASQASYTIYLPVRDYRHVALANAAAEPLVAVDGADRLESLAMRQQRADTIAGHRVGLFSARLPMRVEDRNQEFHAELYMQNCTSCLVLDPGQTSPQRVWGYADGFATQFQPSDSTYTYAASPTVECTLMEHAGLYGLYATTFPSRDRLEAGGMGRGSSAAADKSLWRMHVYVEISGSVTHTILYMPTPLRAGQLRIVKAKIAQDGRVVPTTQNVGVGVELDWKPGGSHDIEV